MSAAFHAHDVRQGVPEQLEALVAPHVDSFDYLVQRGLPEAFRLLDPVEVHDPIKGLKFRSECSHPIA